MCTVQGRLRIGNMAATDFDSRELCRDIAMVRTLIAAQMVFGVSSGQGGLGWFIFENRNLLDIPAVFAGLLTVIVIGLIVENLIFRTIERNTVQKWGTQS